MISDEGKRIFVVRYKKKRIFVVCYKKKDICKISILASSGTARVLGRVSHRQSF